MASFTSIPSPSVGDVLPSTTIGELAQNDIFLFQKPYAQYYNTVATSCPDSTDTQVTLGGIGSVGYGFSVTSNNVIIPLSGVYDVSFSVQVGGSEGSTTTSFNSLVVQNGSPVLQGIVVTSILPTPSSNGSGILACAQGDTVGLYCANLSGSTMPTLPLAISTYIHLSFVGSL